jgi:hypothetical protein
MVGTYRCRLERPLRVCRWMPGNCFHWWIRTFGTNLEEPAEIAAVVGGFNDPAR